MDSSNAQPEGSKPSAPQNPAMASCRKKKTDDATFLEDVKEHIDEFINASMDEHKTCFKKTISKVAALPRISHHTAHAVSNLNKIIARC
jgi:hypothetical protein